MDYLRILPEIVLSIFGMVIMVLDPLMDERQSRKTLGAIALAGAVAGMWATWRMARSPGVAFWNMVRVDGFSVFFHFLIIAIAAVVILISFEYMAVQQIRAGEYYGLILFGVVGMALMSSAIELMLIFIALEISSISSYVLAGFRRQEAASSESSLKYFLLGSFATAFFLYGIALIFGATGSTNVDDVSRALRSASPPLLAYVSIAHAGYLLVAFAATPELGTSAVMFYTAAYAAMNVGAFAIVSHFANAGERYVTLEDYEGLGRSSPLMAATLAIFLLSLIGIPM